MGAIVSILLIVGVFAVLGLLITLLNRWGERHDRMGGRSSNTWSTTGTNRRADREDD
jgi:hypothetical protein